MGDKYNANRNTARQARIDAGLCRDCGIKPFVEGKSICLNCNKKRTDYLITRRTEQKNNHYCFRCNQPSDNTSLCKSCMNKQVEESRQRRKENKQIVTAFFGGKCVSCNETHIACLTVDHVNNDGYIDCSNGNKRIGTTEWYAQLVKAIKEENFDRNDLQLLCFNCHAKKDLLPWWMENEQ